MRYGKPPRRNSRLTWLRSYLKSKAWELVLRVWTIKQAIFSRLPQRQAEVVFTYWQYFDEDRPSATNRAVAEALGITPEAVRQHCRKAANNREFREDLGF